MSAGPGDTKLLAFQIEPGEPYLLIRGNDPLALDLLTHRLARISATRSTPTAEIIEAAELTNRFRDWKARNATATNKKERK